MPSLRHGHIHGSKTPACVDSQLQVVSRWENNKKRIGKESDRLFRFACFFQMALDLQDENNNSIDRESAFSLVKGMKGLNLTEVVQHIEDRVKGAKQVFISPDLLVGSDRQRSMAIQ